MGSSQMRLGAGGVVCRRDVVPWWHWRGVISSEVGGRWCVVCRRDVVASVWGRWREVLLCEFLIPRESQPKKRMQQIS